MRIALTGSTGKLGSVVLRELRDAGHDVVGLDIVGAREPGFVQVDLTDYGQVVDALGGVDRTERFDAVVHLGAVPAPGIRTDVATFHNNMTSTFNVFWAAVRLGIRRIVYASSETVLGLPFDVPPPYIPVDEDYAARPESVYSIVKVLEEQLATELVRWHPDLSITALRFSNVMVPEDYAEFPSFDVDARDGAQAARLALEHDSRGYDVFVIANADTVMSTPSRQLMAQVFPDVPVAREFGPNETLLSIDKARRVLGFEPQHSWRDEVGG